MKDMVIIGAGPAGLSASIYGIRAGLDILVIEKFSPGGQVMNTFEVENYPGFVEPIAGWELMSKMEEQVRRLGVEIGQGEIISIQKNLENNYFIIRMSDNRVLESRTVIVATGASLRKLNVKGEQDYTGRGVSYCATCDGAFFKDKVTAVVGGGDTALEEAIFLTRFSSKVYIIHRRDEFRGTKILQERLLLNEKIEPVYDTVVEAINGGEKVESISLKNKKTGELRELNLDGVFIFVGYDANTSFLQDELLNEHKEVMVDMEMRTSIPGLFGAGDVRGNSKRQIVMAAADGATAAINAYDYITDCEISSMKEV